MAENIYINLNDPTQNKLFGQMGGSAEYALTMGRGVDPQGKDYGTVAGGVGSKAIKWNKTGGTGGELLPENVRAVIYGIDPTTGKARASAGGYDPFTNATGYAFDPESGALILRTGEGGSAFVGGGYTQDAAGNFIPGAPGSSNMSTNATNTSTTAAGGVSDLPDGVTIVSTYADPTTGDVTAVLSNGTIKVLAKSGADTAAKKSAYDLLYQQFNDLGIGGLVPELKTFIEEGISPSEFTLRLRGTEAYKKRFAANAQRINKGLRALSEAEYIGLEDQYQDIMRRYGLPETYYTRGEMGRQEGFEKFISGDVSPVELEDRISTAQKRVINANPEVAQALKTFYPGISQGDILAYTLDPSKAIEDIKRKVTAAEIGGAAVRAGLTTSAADAEYLQRYGVTKEQADQGYQTAAQIVPRASQLADIYKQGPYTQATAEQEIFNLPGQVEAQKQRKKLTELETSAFSGRAGVGAIARERAGNF
jgi:hypothetical protein